MTDIEFSKKVGARIKTLRKQKKITLQNLQDAGVARAWHICLIQKGLRSPKLLTLKRIADVLKIDIKEFFNE